MPQKVSPAHPKVFNPLNLTREETQEIVNEILANPIAETRTYESPDYEAANYYDSCFFAVIRRAKTFHVWWYDDRINELFWEKGFQSFGEAKTHALQRAKETQEAGDFALADMKSQEREERKAVEIPAVAPFIFKDNSAYSDGWELRTEEDVFTFFMRDPALLRPEEWGNLYDCSLTDSNGRSCWVFRSHQGAMLIESYDE